ncbi:hypothetical protein STCU_01052 [Strigomonas culicis]|uniref:Translation initiation factor 4E n=1 Tax=Strigomonas culicis TaxID=28005 RepID=S9UXP1_9TRYP|nr:hypothetical protein STCU_05453 [Strigomonas culicis]EPY35622.1 hypothetical protein STCU_01052 [Strigomonas culicis]|eukprot:EPY27885.1 hypothetical protein STCU_05453 [Strigomonas culicis]
MSQAQQHALRNRWFFFYLPLITNDLVNASYNGDWNLAAEELTQRLDWVTTVEELWSSMNSLPKIQGLPVGSTYILSRDGKEASFENFPKGSRLLVNLHKSPATETGLDVVLAAVLGESITSDVGLAEPVCDVIRIAARPNRDFVDLLRVEVWLNDAAYSAKVANALRQALKDRAVPSSTYEIRENPFESAVKKAPRGHSSTELDRSRSTDHAPKEVEPEAPKAEPAPAPKASLEAEPPAVPQPAGATEAAAADADGVKGEGVDRPEDKPEEAKQGEAEQTTPA